MFKTLLVDSSYLAYQSYFSPQVIGENHMHIAYGYLSGLGDTIRDYEISEVIVAWDQGHRVKDALYPQYKAGRKSKLTNEQREQFNLQFDTLNGILFDLGIRCCYSTGFEADDIIAHVCAGKPIADFHVDVGHIDTYIAQRPILILSGDHDLYALLSDDVSIWKSRKRELYTIEAFRREYPGLTPTQYTEILALAGCSSDNVPGARGIGPASAKKLLAAYGSIDAMLAMNAAENNDKLLLKVLASRDNVLLSRQLVTFETVKPIMLTSEAQTAKVKEQILIAGMGSVMDIWPELSGISRL